MTNKQLFIQKLSSILKEKNNRIKIVMMGQETVEVFTKALKEPNASVPESVFDKQSFASYYRICSQPFPNKRSYR